MAGVRRIRSAGRRSPTARASRTVSEVSKTPRQCPGPAAATAGHETPSEERGRNRRRASASCGTSPGADSIGVQGIDRDERFRNRERCDSVEYRPRNRKVDCPTVSVTLSPILGDDDGGRPHAPCPSRSNRRGRRRTPNRTDPLPPVVGDVCRQFDGVNAVRRGKLVDEPQDSPVSTPVPPSGRTGNPVQPPRRTRESAYPTFPRRGHKPG